MLYYSLAADVSTVLAYLLIKHFCWNYRLQAVVVLIIIVYVLLLGMCSLSDNSLLTKVLLD